MAGPFHTPPMHNLHISPVGVVSKADVGWRMIMHLSYPPSISINQNIDPIHTTVTYTSFNRVIKTISLVGKEAMISKCDIKSAFRLIRVYPGDFELLGLYFNGNYYFDKCLPFGCAISCRIFEMFATFLEWLVRDQTNLQTVHHYLDDFIFIGKPNTNQCNFLMSTFREICNGVGCGCYFQGQWVFLQWPDSWANTQILRDITFLELVPIVLALHIWGEALQKKQIILFVDNMPLVHILNKQSSRSDRVMSFLRSLILVTLQHNIQFKAQHILGIDNKIADAISRKQWDFFRRIAPNADKDPQPIPRPFQILFTQTK